MTPMLKAYKRRCEHPLSAGLCQVGRKQFVQDSSSWPRFEPNYPRPSERHDNPSFPERFDYTPNQASSMCPGQANCKYQKLNYYLLLFSLAPRTLVPCNQVLSLRLEGVGALGGKPHWPLLSLSLLSLAPIILANSTGLFSNDYMHRELLGRIKFPFEILEVDRCHVHVPIYLPIGTFIRRQWSGNFLGIITGWDPSVCKSNRWLHVHILRVFFF